MVPIASEGSTGTLAKPRQHRRVLRKEPDLARQRRPELEGQLIDLDRPWAARGGVAEPAAFPLPAQIGRPPRRGFLSWARRAWMRSLDDPLTEPLQPRAPAEVEQRVPGGHVRALGRAGRASAAGGRTPRSAP